MPLFPYTETMKTMPVKKVYTVAAVIILLLAVVVSGWFIYLGFKNKSEPSQQVTSTRSNQSSQNIVKNQKPATNNSYNLIISKIGVTAPIITGVDGNNKDTYNKALEDGVAQLQGSALPGKNGNSFVFGHSSYYAEKPGNYKEVFAKLNDLNPGDQFEVQNESARYVYKITDKKVVESNDVTVAAQNLAIKQMTLMTCWPVGTTKQRLVVVGELIEN